MRWCLQILVFGVVLFPVLSARASLLISVESLTLQPGESGVVDVWISSDSSDAITTFGFEFRIEPIGGTSTQLRFLDPQEDLQLGDPAYLFSGGSFRSASSSSVGSVEETITPADTFIGGDFSTVFGGATVPASSSPALLAKLQAVPGPGTLQPQADDAFQVSLIAGANTVFNAISFSATPGTITVTSPTTNVIPEPTSMAIWLLGVAGVVGVSWRRRKKTLQLQKLDPKVA